MIWRERKRIPMNSGSQGWAGAWFSIAVMGSVGIIVVIVPCPHCSPLSSPSIVHCSLSCPSLVLTLQAVACGGGGRSLGIVGVFIFFVFWAEGVSESGCKRMGAYLTVFPIHSLYSTSLSQSSPNEHIMVHLAMLLDVRQLKRKKKKEKRLHGFQERKVEQDSD